MAKLAPSILSADFYRLGEDVEMALNTGADWIHVDVMDGHFVPPLTFGSKIVGDIKKNNPNAFCDVHLMVTNPQDLIPQFINAGADLINFHCEAVQHGDRFINMIKEHGKMAGITLNPATPVSMIKHFLPLVDLVLVMSVNPGYSGQSGIDYAYQKIDELKTIRDVNSYRYVIEIDGGVSLKNAEHILALGADVIVAGSGFFGVSQEDRTRFVDLVHG